VLSNRYEIVSEIGEGGFGRVYEARDTLLDRAVALKMLEDGGDSSPSGRQRFLKEARASARLQHPNVVALHDAGEDPKGLFLALELVKGTPLKRRIDSGAVTAGEALDVVRQIAAALSAAHALGIVHRDIKPANVLVTNDGVVKVADFGIARLVGETQITAEGRILGTPHYMAPEQIEGKVVTPKADLFSLGCLLYELSTGETPFRGSFTEVLAKILRGAPPPLPPEVPPKVRSLAARLLAKNPDERPSAAEVLAELSVSESLPLPKSGRNPWFVRGVLGLAAAALVAAALYVAGSSRSNTRVETAQLELTRLRATPEQFAFLERCIRRAGVDRVNLKILDERRLELSAESDALANASSIIGLFDALDGYRATREPNLFNDGTRSDRLVSLDFQELRLPSALNAIAAAASWPILHSPKFGGGEVTFTLIEVSWDVAVRTLLEANDLDTRRYGDVWLVATREEVPAIDELEELEVVVKRPERVSPEAMMQALEPARTESGVLTVNPRLGAVVIADRTRAFSSYEKIYAAIEGVNAGGPDFPASEYSGDLFPPVVGKPEELGDLPFPYATDYPVGELLSFVADISGLNIVFLAKLPPGEDRVSLSAQGVPWDNVLEVFIRSRRLFYGVDENVVQIVSSEQRGAEPVLETISLRREDPEFFRPFEKCLTPAGSLRIEPSSRTLIVRDVPWRARWFVDLAAMIDERDGPSD
jgi:hypothetical protein